eukprot:scaffold73275_cov21-Prasinocladus_malaysianus.AAC.1
MLPARWDLSCPYGAGHDAQQNFDSQQGSLHDERLVTIVDARQQADPRAARKQRREGRTSAGNLRLAVEDNDATKVTMHCRPPNEMISNPYGYGSISIYPEESYGCQYRNPGGHVLIHSQVAPKTDRTDQPINNTFKYSNC